MNNIHIKKQLLTQDRRRLLLRDFLVEAIALDLYEAAKDINRAWEFVQIESPSLVDRALVSKEYSETDFFAVGENLALKPETTFASYEYLDDLLTSNPSRYKLPLCIYQLSKSYRNEQDKTNKHLRLREFYQLEFQFIYSDSSKADYVSHFRKSAEEAISRHFRHTKIRSIPSDRLPSYSRSTQDIEIALDSNWNTVPATDNNADHYWMEVASMSDRDDCIIPNTRNIEIAIGLDRLVSLY